MTKYNSENIDRAFALTMELEGLLVLVQSREEMTPPLVFDMIRDKISMLSGLFSADHEAASFPVAESATAVEIDEAPVSENGNAEDTESSFDQIIPEETISDDDELQHEAGGETEKAGEFIHHLTLNDKYLFRRELFGNSQEEFVSALETLASIGNIDDAEDYLYNDLCLSAENPVVKSFVASLSKMFE